MFSGGAQASNGSRVAEIADACIREQLERILRSAAFRHSAQHRTLLAYLVRESCQGHADELKEYSVGVDALGRPEGYNPRQDATARIQTGRLRARLEEYYRTEGAADPLVLSIPKGGFKVHFRNRSAVEELGGLRKLRRLCAGLGILLAAAVAVSLWLAVEVWRGRASARLSSSVWTPELEALWRPFLHNDRPLTLSLGTPLFFSVGGVLVRQWGENEWQEGQLPPAIRTIRDALRAPYVRPFHAYNGFGETTGAIRLQRLFLSRGKDLTFRRSDRLSWDDFRERDLILLGSPKSVAHLKHFRDLTTNLAFAVQEDRIVNFAPAQGEAPSYTRSPRAGDSTYDGYALVTRLQGFDGAGNIMILGSPDTEGTLAACEYVTNPQLARELVREVAPGGRPLPEAYQVLLKATFRADVPLKIARVTHREIKPGAAPAARQ